MLYKLGTAERLQRKEEQAVASLDRALSLAQAVHGAHHPETARIARALNDVQQYLEVKRSVEAVLDRDPPAAPCPCGSGKPFPACHGLSGDEPLD